MRGIGLGLGVGTGLRAGIGLGVGDSAGREGVCSEEPAGDDSRGGGGGDTEGGGDGGRAGAVLAAQRAAIWARTRARSSFIPSREVPEMSLSLLVRELLSRPSSLLNNFLKSIC